VLTRLSRDDVSSRLCEYCQEKYLLSDDGGKWIRELTDREKIRVKNLVILEKNGTLNFDVKNSVKNSDSFKVQLSANTRTLPRCHPSLFPIFTGHAMVKS